MDTFALSDGEFGVTFCQPLRDGDGWLESFVVRIEEPGLSAMAQVENLGVDGPEQLFAGLAQNWRGWSGEKTWRSLAAQLTLSATTDARGHITIRIQLRPTANCEAWRVTSFAYFEAGQLDTLAARAAKFFGPGL